MLATDDPPMASAPIWKRQQIPRLEMSNLWVKKTDTFLFTRKQRFAWEVNNSPSTTAYHHVCSYENWACMEGHDTQVLRKNPCYMGDVSELQRFRIIFLATIWNYIPIGIFDRHYIQSNFPSSPKTSIVSL